MKLPDGWRIIPLNQVIHTLQAGVSVNSLDEEVKDLRQIGILKTSSVTTGRFDPRENKVVVQKDICRVKTPVQGDRIILSRMNTPCLVGANAYVPQDHPNLFLPDRLWSLEPLGDFICMRWLSFVLGFSEYRQKLSALATGTSNSMKNISKDAVMALEIPYPPLPEQRRIAEFLGTWDEAIEKLERLIAAKEKRFRGLIQMLISGKKGQWPTIRLGTLFSERNESNYPLGELLAITGERGVVRRCELDKVDSSSEDKSQYLRIHPGDIGYNTMRMWQGVCGVSRYDGIVSPAYTILVPDQKVNADFAVFYFKTPLVIHIFKRHSQGLVDDTLNLKYHHFSQIRLPFPELSEQNRIAEILTIAQNELNLLRKELAALQKQKRGLMQKLLTGMWRI